MAFSSLSNRSATGSGGRSTYKQSNEPALHLPQGLCSSQRTFDLRHAPHAFGIRLRLVAGDPGSAEESIVGVLLVLKNASNYFPMPFCALQDSKTRAEAR